MRLPHPPETQTEVIKLYLSGFTFTEIANKCSVSTGYVSEVIKKFSDKLENGEISTIREFSRTLRKSGISTSETFFGAKIYSDLKKFGINQDSFAEFVSEVYYKCKNEGLDTLQLVKYSKMLYLLEKKTDVALEEIPSEYTGLYDKSVQLKKEILSLNEDAKKANSEASQALIKKNLTFERVNQYLQVRDDLEKKGVDFKNLSKLATILNTASENNYDVGRIIGRLKKEEKFEQQIVQLKEEIGKLCAIEKKQARKNEEQTKKIEGQKLLVSRLQSFESVGIKDENLQCVFHTILEIAKTHNINEKSALKKLDRDLRNNYDKKIGLGIHLEKLENEIRLKKQELESNQIKIENFNLKHKENLKTLQILKELKKNQINPELIVVWNRVFRSVNLDPKIFLQKISKHSDLNKINEIEQQTVKQLKKDRTQLESKVNWLKSQKEELESTIKYGKEFTIEQIDKTIKYAQNQILNTSSSATNSISSVRTKAVEDINSVIEKTDKHLSDRLAKLDESITTGMTVSEKIGKFQAIVPLLELINGSKYDVCEASTCLLMVLDKLSLQIQKNGNSSHFFLEHIKSLREDLMEVIRQN